MIQATVAHTRPSGLFATLKSLLFSGGPVSTQTVHPRRAMTEAERRSVFNLRDRVGALADTHEVYSDDELTAFMVGNVIEPLQDLMREVAAEWGEPHLGQLSEVLTEVNCRVASFDEKLVDREDMVDGLDALHFALGQLARGLSQ